MCVYVCVCARVCCVCVCVCVRVLCVCACAVCEKGLPSVYCALSSDGCRKKDKDESDSDSDDDDDTKKLKGALESEHAYLLVVQTGNCSVLVWLARPSHENAQRRGRAGMVLVVL